MKEAVDRVMKAFAKKHTKMTPEQERRVRDEVSDSLRNYWKNVPRSSVGLASRARAEPNLGHNSNAGTRESPPR